MKKKKLDNRKVSTPQSVLSFTANFPFHYTENTTNRRRQIRVFSIHTNNEKYKIMRFSQRFLWRLNSSGTRNASLRVVFKTFRRISKVEQPKVKALWTILREVRNSSSSDTLPHFERLIIFSEKRIWSYYERFGPSQGEFIAYGFGSKI